MKCGHVHDEVSSDPSACIHTVYGTEPRTVASTTPFSTVSERTAPLAKYEYPRERELLEICAPRYWESGMAT